MLGADTRSTSGSTVADKNCEKIHYIAPNIYCCGAGTAADTENTTGAPPLSTLSRQQPGVSCVEHAARMITSSGGPLQLPMPRHNRRPSRPRAGLAPVGP